MIDYILFGTIAYLFGSIPTAVWLGKVKYGVDVREHGSKNAGATNTFRVLGKKPGIVVLVIDILKGFIAVTLPVFFYTQGQDEIVNIQLICAITSVFGHVFPVFAKFKGGKGVATSLGVIVGLHPSAAVICVGIFLIVFISSKYVSLGAMIAAISFPILVICIFKVDSFWLGLFSAILALAVVISHRKNIKRLINREENKMNLFKRKA
ncbi:MAG: glycerol-3-phosphate 1-O-acyltransferase PlsY [Crocinitomicaceae bacterium]|nr:glycerol-3-phosphate 1-O-acyltransferase PlsY [Crocinitomicaceae bacterium]